jgi:uncharacterized delta-60 repeat protein
MKNTALLLFCFWITTNALSQAGTLDPLFGTVGIVKKASPASGNINSETARKCIMQADGKILLVIDIGGKAVISRRLANGARDLSFAHNGFSEPVDVSNPVAAIQPDGKIVIAGGAQNSPDFLVARFNPDGSLDANFGHNGVVVTDAGTDGDFASTVAIAADGKIYVGGSTNNNVVSHFALIRYTSSGLPDATFGQNGIVITNIADQSSYILAVATTPDGKVIALGQVAGTDGGDYAMVKYNSNGTPDLLFNRTGQLVINFGGYDSPASIAVSSDGKIYAGGFDAQTGFQHFRISRFNANGSLDLTYNNGTGTNSIGFGDSNDRLTNILLLNDGKILAAGQTGLNMATGDDIELVRLNIDGTLDLNFGTNGLVTSDINASIDQNNMLATDVNGNILAGGYNIGTGVDYTLFRYNNNGIPDAAFGTGGGLIDFVPGSTFSYGPLFKQPDGKFIVSGGLNTGNTSSFLARFNSNGSPDNSFGQNGELAIPSGITFFQPDGKGISLAIAYSANGGDFSVSRYYTDGTPDPGFGNAGTAISDFGGNEFANSNGTIQNDGKIIVPGFQYADFGNHTLIARYNSNGTLDNSFGNGGVVNLAIETESSIQSIAVQPDGKIIGCGYVYSYPPDFSYFHFDELLVRLNPDGSLDNTFGNSGILIKDRAASEFATGIAVQADNKIVYAYAAGDNGYYKYYAERLNNDGSTDISFGQNGQVLTGGAGLLLQADQKIIVSGQSPDAGNRLQSFIKRLNQDGGPDNSFGINGTGVWSFAAGDNYVYANVITGNSLFATGRAINLQDTAIIAKINLLSANSLACPTSKIVSTDPGLCSAKVNGIDPTLLSGSTVKYKLTGATKGAGNGTVSGKVFNKGVTTVMYTLSSDAAKTCGFTVTVQDKESPVIGYVSISHPVLWPADHKMKDITLNYDADDNCGITTTQLLISSNEPAQSNENGDQSPDWQILDNHHIRLRAERLQSGNGRIYTVTIRATDLSGNSTSKTITINVPKNFVACNLNINASPNPSHSSFLVTIISSCQDKINMRLFDNYGNVLKTFTNISAPKILNIGDNLQPGIYYLEGTQGNTFKSLKLIKQ